MVKIYNSNITTNELKTIKEITKGSWINMINPTEEEIKKICEAVKIKEDFIRYSLDYEEKARIDEEDEDETILFLIDVPIIEKEKEAEIYTTMPLGMIVVRDEYFITVSLKRNLIIDNFEKKRVKGFSTYKKSRFLLQIMFTNASHYLTYLKQINKETEIAESTLKNSMKNRELLKLLSLEKA